MSTQNAEGPVLDPNHAAHAGKMLPTGSLPAPTGHLIFTSVTNGCAAETIERVRNLGLRLRFPRGRAKS